MKYWVQFLQKPVSPATGLIDACGDRGVFVLDGRNSELTMHRDALRAAQRLEHWQRWPAYVLCCGPRLFDEHKRTAPVHITYPVNV